MRRLWSALDDLSLGAWARAFFLSAGAVLVVAAATAAVAPDVQYLRAKEAQLLRDNQALQSRMRQGAKTLGKRDARLEAMSAGKLRLELWKSRQSADANAASALERERSLREIQSSIGREADLEEQRRLLVVRLRPLERLDAATVAGYRVVLALVLLCLFGAARLWVLGRVAVPVATAGRAGWRRTLDSAGRIAVSACWAWVPCVTGAWIFWSEAARGYEGEYSVALLASCGVATMVGGLFVSQDVAVVLAKRDWWVDRLISVVLRIGVPMPGAPRTVDSGAADPEDTVAAARGALGIAGLVTWLGIAASIAAGLGAVAPAAGAVGAASASLVLLAFAVYASRAKLAETGWPQLALGAFGALALAGLPHSARLAVLPQVASREAFADDAAMRIDKAQTRAARLPAVQRELEKAAADPGAAGSPNSRHTQLTLERQELTALIAQLKPMKAEYERLSARTDRWRQLSQALGWLAAILGLLSLRFAWLTVKSCRSGGAPDLGSWVAARCIGALWSCALLCWFQSRWIWLAVPPWIFAATALWGSARPWRQTLDLRRFLPQSSADSGAGVSPPEHAFFHMACAAVWVAAALSIAVTCEKIAPLPGAFSLSIVGVGLLVISLSRGSEGSVWSIRARQAFACMGLACAGWALYVDSSFRLASQKQRVAKLEYELDDSKRIASLLPGLTAELPRAIEEYQTIRRSTLDPQSQEAVEAYLHGKGKLDLTPNPRLARGAIRIRMQRAGGGWRWALEDITTGERLQALERNGRGEVIRAKWAPNSGEILEEQARLSSGAVIRANWAPNAGVAFAFGEHSLETVRLNDPAVVRSKVVEAGRKSLAIAADIERSKVRLSALPLVEADFEREARALARQSTLVALAGYFAAAMALASLVAVFLFGKACCAGLFPGIEPAIVWRLGFIWTAALSSPTEFSVVPVVCCLLAMNAVGRRVLVWAWAFVTDNVFRFKGKTALALGVGGELPILTRYLLVAVRQGMPLHEALRAHAATIRQRRVREMLELLADKTASGEQLNQAIAQVEREKGMSIFPPAYLAMLKAGEASSDLPKALALALKSVERAENLEARFTSALGYVAVLVWVGGAVVVFMLAFVVPTFKQLFASFGAELPAPTQFLIALSDALRYLFFPIALIVVRSAWSWKRHGFASGLVWLPGMRTALGGVVEARLCNGLSLLLSAGCPAEEALVLMSGAVEGTPIGRVVGEAAERVRRGESLAKSLGASPGISSEFLWACELGEHRGDLPDTLSWLAGYLDIASDRRMLVVSAILERSLTVLIAVVMGGAVIAMFLPMFSLGSLAWR